MFKNGEILKSGGILEEIKNQFQQDFELVCEHNNFTATERTEALDIAKANNAGARECFGSIAASLRRDGSDIGLNERIRARIAADAKAAA